MAVSTPLRIKSNSSHPSHAKSAHATVMTAVSRTKLAVGSQLDGYEIEGLLGRGGMGVVYSARELKTNQKVAIKVLGEAINSDVLIRRFCREASTVAQLHHPGIVELHSVGQTESLCYIVMEIIEGISLREWLDRIPHCDGDFNWICSTPQGNTSPEETPTFQFDAAALRIQAMDTPPPSQQQNEPCPILNRKDYHAKVIDFLMQLLEAIQHAHQQGVIHRDLKPENVIIQPNGRVVIIDFGLARSFIDTTITTQSCLLGTPLYMSPEQLQGFPAKEPADIYAIGLIGYELLTRTLPFRTATIETLLNHVLYSQVPPLTRRNPSLPIPLANVIHKAMAKDPHARYQSASEFLADLQRVANQEHVTAPVYRYRFQSHQVEVSRPRIVAATSYLLMAISAFYMMLGLVVAVRNIQVSVTLFSICAVYFLTAIACRSGWRWIRTVGWSCIIATISLCIIYFYTGSKKTASDLIVLYFMVSPLVLCCILLTFTLFSPSVRRWVELVREKRREFEESA